MVDRLSAARLFLSAEIHSDHVGAVFIILNRALITLFWCVVLRIVVLFRCHVGHGGLKLQAEINRWIDESSNRSEGNIQLGRHLVKAEADGKAIFVNAQIPEFVLQHDGHFIGEPFAQMFRDRYPGRGGLEGNVEMVVAWQRAAVLLNFAQHPADYSAQSLLHDFVIGYQAIWRFITHNAC